MAEYGSRAVVWQTAINPVVALEPRRPRNGTFIPFNVNKAGNQRSSHEMSDTA
jgi:hypothetical protein